MTKSEFVDQVADRAGLSKRDAGAAVDAFLDTIEGGPLDVGYAHVKGAMILKREFPSSFPVWGAAKDAGLIAEAAGVAGVQMPVAAGARSATQRAVELGHADDDLAAVWFALGGTD